MKNPLAAHSMAPSRGGVGEKQRNRGPQVPQYSDPHSDPHSDPWAVGNPYLGGPLQRWLLSCPDTQGSCRLARRIHGWRRERPVPVLTSIFRGDSPESPPRHKLWATWSRRDGCVAASMLPLLTAPIFALAGHLTTTSAIACLSIVRHLVWTVDGHHGR